MVRHRTQDVKAGTLEIAFIQSFYWSTLTQFLSNEFAEIKAAIDSFFKHQ